VPRVLYRSSMTGGTDCGRLQPGVKTHEIQTDELPPDDNHCAVRSGARPLRCPSVPPSFIPVCPFSAKRLQRGRAGFISQSGTAIDVSLSKTACASGSFQKTERTGPTDCRRWQRPSLNFRPARPSSMASCAFVTTEVAPISEHSTPKCAPAPARRVANGILRLRYNVRRRCRP
jgi:hypothetical protein